jgi:peptidoglycan hydrolase-like amidase
MLALTFAATVQISVLGSFHPVQLDLQPAKGVTLMVETQGHTRILQGEHTLRITGPARVAGRDGSRVRFRLGLPGGVHREYIGKLEVRKQGGELLAIVEMDLETAVASIVAAEGAPGIPFEAQKAQAVVTRSYLLAAHNRHDGFDFCDTSHCQALREPPSPTSNASRAAAVTRGQVLVYKGEVVAALYSANCGGHTKNLKQSNWSGASIPQPGYPYFAVACPLRGHASGHGVGLCQMGAIYIAEHGYRARIILHHYFPDTKIETIQTQAPKPGTPRTDGITITRAHHASRALTASVGMGDRVAQ